MNLIEQWIALFFDRLPYSEEATEARGKIERALQNKAPDAAPDELAEKYGSYEKLAAIGGYTPEDAAGWLSTEALREHLFQHHLDSNPVVPAGEEHFDGADVSETHWPARA